MRLPPVCLRTADCTTVRIEIDFLRMSYCLNLAFKVAHILCATDAKLFSMLFCMDFMMKARI